jgi:hypothetical protein
LSLVKFDFKIAMSELIKLNLLLSIDPSLDFVGENLIYFKLALCCYIRLFKSWGVGTLDYRGGWINMFATVGLNSVITFYFFC